MENSEEPTSQVSLNIIQQAILTLAQSSKAANLPHNFKLSQEQPAVTRAKQILWPKNETINTLDLLFSQINLSKHQQSHHLKWPLLAIAESDPPIPYPTNNHLNWQDYQNLVAQAFSTLKAEDWDNLSLLTVFLEKYGSCLSFGESDIALIDVAKSTAALASALAHDPNCQNLSLIAGDLSGIQKFIYTIASDGALKSLRARSFYLELVAEEIVQQILEKLKLPRTSIIYAGGGNLYLLAPGTEDTQKTVEEVQKEFNNWLVKKFQAKIFLALDSHEFPVQDVASQKFTDHWNQVIKKINQQKNSKFTDQISQLIQPQVSYDTCRVCHREDTQDLEPLNPEEPNSVLACPTCRNMFQLGEQLFNIKSIVRSRISKSNQQYSIRFNLDNQKTVYYYVSNQWNQIVTDADTVLLVNDWDIEHYQFRQFRQPVPLLLGNYAALTEQQTMMRAGELAEVAQGIKRVGYLRMDVDKLGQIFAKGLGQKQTLPRLAGLSRMMTYFFKVYLNSLAQDRVRNLPDKAKQLTHDNRPNLIFIYAGGDDLFVSGSWNEVVEFSFDVYQSFRAYTGNNPDITLSAGISLETFKFPLYQAASNSGEAEKGAKNNGRDSLGLFGEVFKWGEWLGTANLDSLSQEIKDYLNSETLPQHLGIFPLVDLLEKQKQDINYARSFVRNLLATATLQNQMLDKLDKIKDEKLENIRGTRYYLHLPKLAYTLTRLPKYVRENPTFEEIRKSLLSPYNAPYFKAIATWIELLNRSSTED